MKKLKLLMSVSLLCLSIAILCVGVFSAINVDYNIGGTVTYDVEDVYCKIKTKVYKVEAQKTAQELQEDVETLSSTPLDEITYTLAEDKGEYDSYLSKGTAGATGININFGKETSSGKYYYTYFIVTNIENLSSATNMYAVLNGTNYETNVTKSTYMYQNKILKDSKNRNIVIGYSLTDLLTGTSNVAFNYTLSVALGEYNLLKSCTVVWRPNAQIEDDLSKLTGNEIANNNYVNSSVIIETNQSVARKNIANSKSGLISVDYTKIEGDRNLRFHLGSSSVICCISFFITDIPNGDYIISYRDENAYPCTVGYLYDLKLIKV